MVEEAEAIGGVFRADHHVRAATLLQSATVSQCQSELALAFGLAHQRQ
jgi:hypothetical protein